MEISLFTDSAVLFFGFLGLLSVAEAVSSSKFAPPFNDSRQSLKGLNRAGVETYAGSDNLDTIRCLSFRQIQTRKAKKARKSATFGTT